MENNKEELKKLESQYNRYMKIIKIILLIVLFVVLILATRFFYIFSIMSKSIKTEYADLADKNMKKTYSYTYPDYPEENIDCIYYCKDGITVMETSFFRNYIIDNKIYNFYPLAEEKTYSVHDNAQVETWEDLSFFKKIAVIAVKTSSYFTSNISHEELNGQKCIVFTEENEKVYYDAKTCLHIRTLSSNSIIDIKYEFDVVTDEDIKLPDLSEYVLDED